MLSRWTVMRATVTGLFLGLLALLLATFAENRALLLVYAGLLVLTMVCGASILLISLIDAHARQRGERVRPIRMFDLAMGAFLVLPPGYGLYKIWPLLGF